jgi:pantothenate kinase
LVVTEGNYLLLGRGRWAEVRPELDECWYVDPGEERRIAWLIDRHQQFGRTLDQATDRSLGSDQRNAEVVGDTRAAADLIVRPIAAASTAGAVGSDVASVLTADLEEGIGDLAQ